MPINQATEDAAVAALKVLTDAIEAVAESQEAVIELLAEDDRLTNLEIRYKVMASNVHLLGMVDAFGGAGLFVALGHRAEARAKLPAILKARAALDKKLQDVDPLAFATSRKIIAAATETGNKKPVETYVIYKNPNPHREDNSKVVRKLRERVKTWFCTVCGRKWSQPTFSVNLPKYCPLTEADEENSLVMSECQRKALYEQQHKWHARERLAEATAEEKAIAQERAEKEAQRIAAGGKRRGRPRRVFNIPTQAGDHPDDII